MHPLVTVVVAARDEAPRIGRALSSLLAQTREDWEAVVVDDGSRDATSDVVRSFADPRITLVRCDSPVGRGAARNLAVERARGRWIAVQDADDVSAPDRLERLVQRAEAGDDPVAVSGQAVCVTPRGREWRLRAYPLTDAAVKAELATGSMSVCHAACMVRRDVLDRVGGYDPTCLRAQDLNLFLRLMPLGPVVAVPEVLVRYEHQVLLPYGYWRTSSRFAEQARRRARYGIDWRSAPDLRPEDVLAAASPLEPLRWGASTARRAGRFVRDHGLARA